MPTDCNAIQKSKKYCVPSESNFMMVWHPALSEEKFQFYS